jgi:polyhydroxyalkanoate synthesis repressor PhaR
MLRCVKDGCCVAAWSGARRRGTVPREARVVVVKKYGNRRLYDTQRSAYVNLEDVAALIRAGEDVQVVDARTGEDLTGEVLLQVVMESLQGADLIPLGMLRRIIRVSGDGPMERTLRQQLASGLALLSDQLDRAEGFLKLGGLGAPAARGKKAPPPVEPEPEPEPEPAMAAEPEPEPYGARPPPAEDPELERLSERLAAIEARLAGHTRGR